MDAAMRWIKESSHERSLVDDKHQLRWLDSHFRNLSLCEIDRHLIAKVADAKTATGVTNATVNRMLALVRSILNKATHEWEWIDKAPKIKLRKEDNHRTRWLTHAEA